MRFLVQRLLWGAVLNLLLAAAAYRKKAVTHSGGLTGFILGTCIFIGGGLYFWLHLGAFFISSTFLSRITTETKRNGAKMHQKDGMRDGMQVVSNIGPAAVAALMYAWNPAPAFLVAFAASLAAANADTWAGEIGMLTSNQPVSIINGRPLPSGTSGAVTKLGFWASFFGSLFIALLFAVGYVIDRGFSRQALFWTFIVVLFGFFGSVIDSLLGATIQAEYRCAVTREHTERAYTENVPNLLIKGYPAINNDMVNLISVAAVSSCAAIVTLVL